MKPWSAHVSVMVFCFCHCVCYGVLFLSLCVLFVVGVCLYEYCALWGQSKCVTFIQAEKRTDDERRAADVFNTDYRSRQRSAQKIKALKTDSVALVVVFVLFYIKLPSTVSFHIHTHTYTNTEAHSHSDQPLRCSSDWGLNSRPHQISGHSQASDLTFLLWFKDVSNNESASSA